MREENMKSTVLDRGSDMVGRYTKYTQLREPIKSEVSRIREWQLHHGLLLRYVPAISTGPSSSSSIVEEEVVEDERGAGREHKEVIEEEREAGREDREVVEDEREAGREYKEVVEDKRGPGREDDDEEEEEEDAWSTAIGLGLPISISARPTFFPRHWFKHATETLCQIFNELYSAVASDEEWLRGVFVTAPDPLSTILWSIHHAAEAEKCERGRRRRRRQQKGEYAAAQDGSIFMGIWRSDYMLHNAKDQEPELSKSSLHEDKEQGIGEYKTSELKQVEFNTFFCTGAGHATNISALHRHQCRSSEHARIRQAVDRLPHNDANTGLIDALEHASHLYIEQYCSEDAHRDVCVLMIVQPHNVNICDERPIEYGLWDRHVSTFRLLWGKNVLQHTSVSEEGALLYHPSGNRSDCSIHEVSVVYWRAGLYPEEYDKVGFECRLRLERSRAVMCPSVLSHLSGFKKVQQVLAMPGALSRFLSSHKAALVQATFMNFFPLDNDSDEGKRCRDLLRHSDDRLNSCVLKPSLEGGGNNVFRDKISLYMTSIPEDTWSSYILMQLINPPSSHNLLLLPEQIYQGKTVSELGVFGTCVWRNNSGDSHGRIRRNMLRNTYAGFTLKTKAVDIDEMGVVKGYGCFSSPTFAAYLQNDKCLWE